MNALQTVTPLRPSLWVQLQQEPYRFSFHQAIQICAAHSQNVPHASPFFTPYQIKSHVYLAYPPSDVYALVVPHKTTRSVRLISNILGVAGVQGPLPLPFTEQILYRNRQKDFALQDFLDLFNHRLSLLYHHTVQKYRLSNYHGAPSAHPYGQVLQSFLGEEAPEGCLHYASLFWHQPRSWKGLEILLSCFLRRVVQVAPYQGGWVNIEPENMMRLTRTRSLNGSFALGRRVWQQTKGLIITVLLQTQQDLFDHLPGQASHKTLYTLIRRYLGVDMHITLQWTWDQVQPQGITLGRSFFLNWSSFLTSTNPTHPRYTCLKMHKT